MLKLVIGNKNYSSWSMRPWLALRANDIPFEEIFVPLYTDDKADRERLLSFSGADAMFAPVVHRFRTYAIPVKGDAQHYVDAMNSLPAFAEWTRDGLAETLLIERFETA